MSLRQTRGGYAYTVRLHLVSFISIAVLGSLALSMVLSIKIFPCSSPSRNAAPPHENFWDVEYCILGLHFAFVGGEPGASPSQKAMAINLVNIRWLSSVLTGADSGLAPHKGKAQFKEAVFHVPGVFVRPSCSNSRKYFDSERHT